MTDLSNKRVLVTGGNGFLGRHVVAALQSRGGRVVLTPRRADYDLTIDADVRRLFEELRPHVVIHLAAVVGGIGANRDSPGRFFYENVMMSALTMEHARRSGVEKFVGVGTICAYPKLAPVPFMERDLWNGYPEETNAPYGIAKKMLLVQGQAYRAQNGFNAIHLLQVNLYGPHDNFDPASSHVIPALIRKCRAVAAGAGHSVLGQREGDARFLFVEDCAGAIVLATERYDEPDPVNIGAGFGSASASCLSSSRSRPASPGASSSTPRSRMASRAAASTRRARSQSSASRRRPISARACSARSTGIVRPASHQREGAELASAQSS